MASAIPKILFTPTHKGGKTFKLTIKGKCCIMKHMGKSKLDTPHIKKEVTKRLAVGESQSSIARAVGLDQSQVSRWSRKEEIRAGIEEEQRKLLEVVPDAVENVKALVREMKDIPAKDTRRRELSYMATKDVLKSVGILLLRNRSTSSCGIPLICFSTPFVIRPS